MKWAEMDIIRTRNLASNFTEYITDTLLQANLIQECPKDTFLDVKALKQSFLFEQSRLML